MTVLGRCRGSVIYNHLNKEVTHALKLDWSSKMKEISFIVIQVPIGPILSNNAFLLLFFWET